MTAMSEHIVEFDGTITEYNGIPILQDGALREEIVRCRDCQHFTPKGTYKFSNGKVNDDFCCYVRGWRLQITNDGYCAWGERKE